MLCYVENGKMNMCQVVFPAFSFFCLHYYIKDVSQKFSDKYFYSSFLYRTYLTHFDFPEFFLRVFNI